MRHVTVTLILAVAVPALGFTLVDNSSGPQIAVCPCCTSMLSPMWITYLPAGGASALGQSGTLLADYPGCNVVVAGAGGGAPGTLTIDEYYAWCRGMVGGAKLAARYDDGDGVNNWALPWPFGGSTSYRWVQEINTNKPLGGAGSPYIDPRPNDDPPGTPPLPYYWTDPEAINKATNGANAYGNYDLRFSDKPRRQCTQYVTWQADLFIVAENRFTDPQGDPQHQITIYDGVRWGFELFPHLGKLIGFRFYSLIVSNTEEPLIWSEGVVTSQLFGPQNVLTLHPGGVDTSMPDQTYSDYGERFEAAHGDFYSPCDYSFAVSSGDGLKNLSVFVSGLDAEDLWDVSVPVVRQPGIDNLVMSIDLADDYMVLMQEMTTYRSLYEALYAGAFSDFVADPGSYGFTVLGEQYIQMDNVCFPAPGEAIPGDANLDYRVNYLDLGILATHYGLDRLMWCHGDFNTDGFVNYLDLGILATYYGEVWEKGSVPEPAGMLLMALGALGLCRRRRSCRLGD